MATVSPAKEPLERLIEAAQAAEKSGDWDIALRQYELAFVRAIADRNVQRLTEVLRWIGTVHREKGDLDTAYDLYETSRAVAEANRFTDHQAAALNCLGIVAQLRGQQDLAESLYLDACGLAELIDDRRLAAMIDQNLGSLANTRGDTATALVRFQLALECYRAVDDRVRAVGALNNMGMAHVDLGHYLAAEFCYNEALALARQTGDALTLAYVQINRAELFVKRQQYEQARECCNEGFCIFARLESRTGQAEAHKLYGVIFRETAKPRMADVHFGLALSLARAAQNKLLEAEVVHEMGRLLTEEHRHRDAIKRLNEAHRLFREVQAPRDRHEVEVQMAEVMTSYLRVARQWSAEVIDSKDPFANGRSARVAKLAQALGAVAGLDEDDLAWLHVGALLHDVGKTVIPAEILACKGALSAQEWEVLTRHTIFGDQIVTELGLPAQVRPVVRNHHERWDGHGYPDRLAGEDIPLHARVVTVADVFDALVHARNYRRAYSQPEARRILMEEAGRTLDPLLVRLFLEEVLPFTGRAEA